MHALTIQEECLQLIDVSLNLNFHTVRILKISFGLNFDWIFNASPMYITKWTVTQCVSQRASANAALSPKIKFQNIFCEIRQKIVFVQLFLLT